MKITSVEFPDFVINCVGDDKNIEIIEDELNRISKSIMILDKFIDKIISNHIFAYAYSITRQTPDAANHVNDRLKQNNLIIDESKYLEAMFILYPNKMSEILGISKEEKIKFLKDNFWKDRL